MVKSSVLGSFGGDFKNSIFNLVLLTGIFRSSDEYYVWNLIDDKSTLVLVMAWCRQAKKPLPEPKLTQFRVTIWHY